MKRFRVDLKTFLGLAMSNQCCHAVTKLIFGGFLGGILKPLTLLIPIYIYIYSTTVLYDNSFFLQETSCKIPKLLTAQYCVFMKLSCLVKFMSCLHGT